MQAAVDKGEFIVIEKLGNGNSLQLVRKNPPRQ